MEEVAYIPNTSSLYKQLLAYFQPERSTIPPKIPTVFFLVVKVLLVIHSMFQNMHLNLLLMESGYPLYLKSQYAGSKTERLFFKISFRLS